MNLERNSSLSFITCQPSCYFLSLAAARHARYLPTCSWHGPISLTSFPAAKVEAMEEQTVLAGDKSGKVQLEYFPSIPRREPAMYSSPLRPGLHQIAQLCEEHSAFTGRFIGPLWLPLLSEYTDGTAHLFPRMPKIVSAALFPLRSIPPKVGPIRGRP